VDIKHAHGANPVDNTTASCRILIANVPSLLAEAVAAEIRHQPDLRLVGTVNAPLDILTAAVDADVLILGATANAVYPPPICSQLFGEYPYLKVLVIDSTNGHATGYWLGLQRSPMGKLDMATLIDSIRQLDGVDPLP